MKLKGKRVVVQSKSSRFEGKKGIVVSYHAHLALVALDTHTSALVEFWDTELTVIKRKKS